MADQLAVWNIALGHIGQRRIAALDEPREPARVLADEWDAAVRGCLEMTAWTFATRRVTLTPASSGVGTFTSKFTKPADWLRTVDISPDDSLTQPLDEYLEEGAAWYASCSALSLRFVSTDPSYGYNLAIWPQTFADLVALALAARICKRLTGDEGMRNDLLKLRDAAAKDALSLEEATAARAFPLGVTSGETRLSIYNAALAHLGRSRIYSLAQANDTVRELNDQWRGAYRYALQSALWRFAARTATLFPSPGMAPRAGFTAAFAIPSDWVLTANLSQDDSLDAPLDGYVEEAQHWFASCAALTVRYISDDPAFGSNTSLWTPHFCDLVALRLAEMSCGRLAADAKDLWPNLVKMREATEGEARGIEAEFSARIAPAGGTQQTRLQVCNDALAHLGLDRIFQLTDTGSTTRALNDQFRTAAVWCLRMAPWAFAARVVTLQPTGAAPLAPFSATFAKPADWVSTLDLATDAQVSQPVTDFADEAAVWYASANPLVVRYVSSDPAYGLNVALWTPRFLDLVALRLAELCAGRLGAADKLPAIVEKRTAAEQAAAGDEAAHTARGFPTDTAALTQLRIYNDALGYCGQRRIAALTDASLPVRFLNDEWALAARWLLERGPWTFAIRDIMIGPHNASPPTFGFKHSFLKPADWLQTVLVSEFDDFREGSLRYADETGWWFSDSPGLYVRYVSTGPSYGMCVERWSPSFGDVVALRMAEKIAPRLGLSQAQIAGLVALREDAMKELRASDALNTPPLIPPVGSWVRSRRGGWAGGRRYGDGPGGPNVPLTGDTSLSGDTDVAADSDFVPRISG